MPLAASELFPVNINLCSRYVTVVVFTESSPRPEWQRYLLKESVQQFGVQCRSVLNSDWFLMTVKRWKTHLKAALLVLVRWVELVLICIKLREKHILNLPYEPPGRNIQSMTIMIMITHDFDDLLWRLQADRPTKCCWFFASACTIV